MFSYYIDNWSSITECVIKIYYDITGDVETFYRTMCHVTVVEFSSWPAVYSAITTLPLNTIILQY